MLVYEQLNRYDDQTLFAAAEACMQNIADRHRDSEEFEVYRHAFDGVKVAASMNISRRGRKPRSIGR